MHIGMKNKICTRCKKEKSSDNYCVNNANPDNLNYYCKSCVVDIKKARIRKKGSKFYDPKIGFIADEMDLYNIKKCEICQTNFYPMRHGHKRCKSCSYIARNIIHHALTGGRKKGKNWVSQKVHSKDLLAISIKYINTNNCCYCGRIFSDDNTKSLDHITPISMGGQNNADNINISCLKCNYSKQNLELNEWINLCKLVVLNFEKGGT